MLSAYTALVQAIDWTVLGCGVALAVYLAWRIRRSRTAQGLLCYQPPAVSLFEAMLVVVAFLLADIATLALIGTQVPSTATTQPGSRGWHAYAFHDFAGKTTGIVLCVLLLAPPWLNRRTPAEVPTSLLTATRASAGRQVRRGLLAALVLSPPVLGLAFLLEMVWRTYWPDQPPPQHDLLRAMHRSEWGWLGVLQIAMSAIVISPLAEELFFRGVLLSALIRSTNRANSEGPICGAALWPGMVLSAMAFGMVHFAVPQSVFPLMLFGLGLNWLAVWSGSLLPCVVAHAAFNARTILLALIAPELLDAG